jgi:hypothetical protein
MFQYSLFAPWRRGIEEWFFRNQQDGLAERSWVHGIPGTRFSIVCCGKVRDQIGRRNEEANRNWFGYRGRTQTIAAEEQDKKDAGEAVRQNGLAAERKRKQAAADARYTRVKAEEGVKAAEERAKIRTACRVIYDKTADTKIGDLTVREAQQVQACQVLGLYSSR